MSTSKTRAMEAQKARTIKICVYCALAAIFITGAYFANAYFYDSAADSISSQTGVRITEVMSANNGAWRGESGGWFDWAEITNTSDRDVDLTGWKLSDNRIMNGAFVFRALTLKPGESVLVYCAGSSASAYKPVNYAPFTISAGGDSLFLFDKTGALAGEVSIPELPDNKSWALLDETGEWNTVEYYTPGKPNAAYEHELLIHAAHPVESDIIITEVMTSNASHISDAHGERHDWIEICNASDKPVSLNGMALTDDSHNRAKWLFPNVTLEPGEYRIVFASGKSGADGELHANFRLSKDGETLELINTNGEVADRVIIPALPTDGCYALVDGEWTDEALPTPAKENTRGNGLAYESLLSDALVSTNDTGVTLNECVPSTRTLNSDRHSNDWVELYNASNAAVDLSGFGLSDDATKPRKWTFPDGASIKAGGYLVVHLSGTDGYDSENRVLTASFRLSLKGDAALLLSKPDGTIIDRMPVGTVLSGEISIGRKIGERAFAYFLQTTPGKPNTAEAYSDMLPPVSFSLDGGDFPSGETVTVSLSCDGCDEIYYTTDMTVPTQASARYTNPISITETTVIRAAAFKNGAIRSQNATRTYIMGANHDLPVASLVVEPDSLTGEINGMYVNYMKDIVHEGAIEIYASDGSTLVSQPVDVSLSGHGTRKFKQKAFKIVARSKYGSNRIEAKLFEHRDYASFQSLVLRASGQDAVRTRMIDSVLTSLIEGRGIMYQDTLVCVLYVNGLYCGWYNLRERVTTYSIADWMGWDDPENVQMFENNLNITVGKPLDAYNDLMAWIKVNDMTNDENVETVAKFVDIDNYLQYVAFNIFIANTDLGNVRAYRNLERDGKWRWIAFDNDLSFQADLDMARRWLEPGGVGTVTTQDNTLFIGLMQNAGVRDRFLKLMGELLASDYSSENVLKAFKARYDLVYDEIKPTLAAWNMSEETYGSYMLKLYEYAETRPEKLMGYIKTAFSLSDEQMQTYFGKATEEVARYKSNKQATYR